MSGSPDQYVLWFDEIGLADVPRVGGKSASLGELTRGMAGAGVRVPDGFALTADAYRRHLRAAGLDDQIEQLVSCVDPRDTATLARVGARVRELIRGAALPEDVREQVVRAYAELSRRSGEERTDVAVRSSATAEDLPEASFAGQQETYLNVRGADGLERAVRDCMSSLYTDRAIVYRAERGIEHAKVALSVGVQKMVRSDLACAGVMFTIDTESGFDGVVLINASWGLGESLVKGRVNPDEFWVHKSTARKGFTPIIRREIADKRVKLVYAEGSAVREEEVAQEDRRRPTLTDEEVLKLARSAMDVEAHYSSIAGRPTPMDLEWAKDGVTGELFIVQARPETVHARAGAPKIKSYHLRDGGTILVTGKSVGSQVGAGRVRVIRTAAELPAFEPGEVLVAEMTDPDWETVLKTAAALVTDQGGRTCHAAIVSREHGIPCIVGTSDATTRLTDGMEVTVSCAEGDIGRVYEGKVEHDLEVIDPAMLPTPRVPLMLNLADPGPAFRLAQLPCAGVGLLRIEFLISNWIGVHPMALIHPERVEDERVRGEILARASGHESPSEFFVERLSRGVAQIAAAFHPRDVIVRFSDFKTNEYAGLLGGAGFEPREANPMIGFRGASRYYDERYREAFALECEAIRRVREIMGLGNVKVMVPFCRTLREARLTLEEMSRHGLSRGEDGLEVYVMCEIPNNVVLADEFAGLFDGFSIGSNDLTQLALGVDRDSELLAGVFDERDAGVKRLIEMAVRAAKRRGRRIGICGQAPSDYPGFAKWLADIGIDSISLNADSLADVTRALAVGDHEPPLPALPAGPA